MWNHFYVVGAFRGCCKEGCTLIRVLVLRVCDLESWLPWYLVKKGFWAVFKKRRKRSHRWSLTCLGGWCVENEEFWGFWLKGFFDGDFFRLRWPFSKLISVIFLKTMILTIAHFFSISTKLFDSDFSLLPNPFLIKAHGNNSKRSKFYFFASPHYNPSNPTQKNQPLPLHPNPPKPTQLSNPSI